MKRFLLIGGRVHSRHDGDEHYVSAARLLGLYKLREADCVLVESDGRWDIRQAVSGITEPLLVLRVQSDGDYDRALLRAVRMGPWSGDKIRHFFAQSRGGVL